MKHLKQVLALGIAGACLATAAFAQEKPLDKVSMRYGFVATGNDAIWTYGIEKGFFKAEGIDVELREGKGSAVTAQTVAAGTDDFGVDIDGGTFLSLAAKGLPATAVLASVASSPVVVLSPMDKPIKTPAELVGKQIAITAGDGPSALFPVLLQRNKIDVDKVTQVNMLPGPKLTSLLTGRVDGVATNIVIQATLEAKGMKIYPMMSSSFGVATPGQYLITSTATLAAKPELVRRMVHAMQKSLAATAADPVAAADSFSKVYPNYDKATALGEVKLVAALFRSPSTKDKAFGTVSIDDAKAGAEALTAAGLVAPGVDVAKFITNQFIAP